MIAQSKPFITEASYLDLERDSLAKHEYYNGEIFAISGATEAHNLIAGNTYASLHGQLRSRACRIYQSDMRVKVQQTGLNTYPDVTIICGQPHFTDETRDTIVNPVLIIEVLSPSTDIASLQCHLVMEDVYEKVDFLSERLRITRDIRPE